MSVSATEPDWSRERRRRFWDPSRRLLRSIRRYRRCVAAGPLGWLLSRYWILDHRFWSVVTGASIPLDCRIDGGLLLPHPVGVVVHSEARVGPNCLLFQNVTLGIGGKRPGVPTLEGHVDVGAGAVILGGVTLGAHAKVGANAVVLTDVPPGATAIGIPARVIVAVAADAPRPLA